MKKLKRIVSLFLIVSTLLINPITISATSSIDTPNSADSEYSNSISQRTENAFVDVSMFDDFALSAVEQYTAEDERGYFYITDEGSLRSLLTSEQYSAVEQQIEIVNQNSSVMPTAIENGTSSFPYILTNGEFRAFSTDSVWYKCSIRGAVEFTVYTNSKSTITIYKKTLLGKKQLLRFTNRTSIANYKYGDCTVCSDSTTFLINIEQEESVRLTCRVSTHTDKYSNSNGALWVPDPDSAVPYSFQLYQKCWYVDSSRVPYVVDFVSHSNYLDACSSVANGSIGLSSFVISCGASSVTSTLLGIAGVLTSFASPFDFKQDILDDIDNKAGYLGVDSSNRPIYANGVVIKEYLYNGQLCYTVDSWTGPEMYGPEGWTGTWTVNS